MCRALHGVGRDRPSRVLGEADSRERDDQDPIDVFHLHDLSINRAEQADLTGELARVSLEEMAPPMPPVSRRAGADAGNVEDIATGSKVDIFLSGSRQLELNNN